MAEDETKKEDQENIEPTEKIRETLETEYISRIVVDYDRDLDDAIEAGHYDEINPKIHKTKFPKNEAEKGKRELSFKVFSLRESAFSESGEAIEKMAEQGYRPATHKELLAFGEVNPEFILDYPVNALGTTVDVKKDKESISAVVELYTVLGKRRVSFQPYNRKWDRYCRFLGVLKEKEN